jgi:hypothetical protein
MTRKLRPATATAAALLGLFGLTGLAALLGGAVMWRSPASVQPSAAQGLSITTVSTRADRVSGGNVLVEVAAPATPAVQRPPVTVDGRDVSAVFRPAGEPGRFLGLITGLAVGDAELRVDGQPWDLPPATLSITNYPSTGPIVSGPHLQPFVCQTEEFRLPDGSTLGPPLDADCTVQTRVQHVYRAADGSLKPLAATTPVPVPDDVAMTTTLAGLTVPFILRIETGSMNRGIYQNVVLHNPATDPAPTPFTPPPAWNHRLIAIHGVGCPTGWFRQGGAMGVNPLSGANLTRLGEGWAIFTNTLNHPTNSCNAFLAGETTMMGKEHFIETFGQPAFTISMGGSGGAYTSLQVADAFPGLFDGVIITATFPDALSIALAGLDAHLLTHFFSFKEPGRFTDEQIAAITGYSGVRAFTDAANQAQRTDPVPDRADVPGYASARWHAAVPAALRYHPDSNPAGARPTVFDVARNIYGVDPATGFARRPFDNVGVQYGLAALNASAITTTDFLDLNERIGGYDRDANYVAERTAGDPGAILRAYQSGVTLSGGGGLATIPVFDAGGYNDVSGYHYQWFHFAVRERMRNLNGHADNHLMWRGQVPAAESWAVMVDWVAAVKADRSDRPEAQKVVRNKPTRAVDGCFSPAAEGEPARFIAEPQTFGSRPDSRCNQLLPSYSFTRHAAGGPLDASILKCQLKPVDPADYAVRFTAAELDRLRRIFPEGVCDWSRPGVNQVAVVPWASFGPAPGSLAATR